jgi:(S)-2-hydroxyglutarate dehydrogenase
MLTDSPQESTTPAGQPTPRGQAAPGQRAPQRCDLAIVGGGIVGLAVARELIRRNPRASVCVLEREADLGTHQTAHSSGVVHAGLYYEPGSLKARLCVNGARELLDYCTERGIASARSGKLILAASRSELPRLEELERRGRANGVPSLRRVDAAGVREIEPHASAIAGLYSPSTAVVDFSAVARSFAHDVLEAGGALATNCPVGEVTIQTRSLALGHAHGTTEARHAIFCAGAWADRLAVLAGADPDPRIVPFRGSYLQLVPARRHLVRSLIYPVPDPALPFLGVHLTRQIDGEVLIGPTALIALARDGYRAGRVLRGDLLDTLAWPGTWRLFARFWRAGLSELRRAAVRSEFVRSAARLLPELEPADVEPSFSGVRAQALGRDGRLIDDFVFSHTARAIHVRNAPSPAATASLAIARHVADEAERVFGLAP